MLDLWKLNWYHLGDVVTCVAPNENPAGTLDNWLIQASTDTLKEIFRPTTRGGVPPLISAIREEVVDSGVYNRADGMEWEGDEFKGFHVQFVDMEATHGKQREREFLLTPDSLYLPVADLSQGLRARLGREGIDVKAAPNLPKAPYMWVDVAMRMGDVLTKCRASVLPSDPDQMKAALRVAAGQTRSSKRIKDLVVNDPTAWRSLLEASTYGDTDIGTFIAQPPILEMRRDESFLYGAGDSTSGFLAFQLGKAKNDRPRNDDQILQPKYNPWPCGGFKTCGSLTDCDKA